jgi:hypothetical protein
VLPVELLTFGADNTGNSVLAHWSTATEHGASHFDVQRSTDGLLFEHVGRVEAAGNSTTTTDYTLIDDAPLDGLSYYRLLQVDLDGQQAMSMPVAVDCGARPPGAPFPNPVSDLAWWQLPKGSVAVQVSVVDALGHTVLLLVRTDNDNGLVLLPVAGLPRGAYALMALDADENMLARTTLVKY